ncbi:MAG: DUF2092 domain-containing protein [Solirubrobacteraceae bacterium]|nr:DUF2092 domain-containing protein [Solirubrobacteraceae bacterium]
MRRLRTTSTRRLLTALACAGVLVMSVAIAAQAALSGSGPVPPPKALAQAIKDALGAPSPDGLTARITFTNDLLPGGSLPGASSALTSGADGRLWLAKDGRLRLELQADSGDVQISSDGERITLFDSASNTVYRAKLPAVDERRRSSKHDARNITLAKVQAALERLTKLWTVSGADPTTVADQPAYSVRIAPKDDGGLLGAARLAWDAVTGVPLRAAVYAQGQSSPVLELEATDISYGEVADADVATTVPAGAKVVDLRPKGRPAASAPGARSGAADAVRGVAAVADELDFALAAPDELAGLPRRGVHLVEMDGRNGALVTYGEGLGAIVVLQHKPDPRAAGEDEPARRRHGAATDALPRINIDGVTGTELATALGTIVMFEREGVSYVVAGSVPPLAAENAARGLK